LKSAGSAIAVVSGAVPPVEYFRSPCAEAAAEPSKQIAPATATYRKATRRAARSF
jgi:hypothetical protein